MPDNTSGAITPQNLRNVAEELMRSSANLAERAEFAETVESLDSVKSDEGFFQWNGSSWVEIGSLSDTAVWSRSGGFILPMEFADKLRVDTAQIDGLIYPNGNVNIGSSTSPFDTVFADVIDGVSGAWVEEADTVSVVGKRIGIGTSSPAATLDVDGTFQAKDGDSARFNLGLTTLSLFDGAIDVLFHGAVARKSAGNWHFINSAASNSVSNAVYANSIAINKSNGDYYEIGVDSLESRIISSNLMNGGSEFNGFVNTKANGSYISIRETDTADFKIITRAGFPFKILQSGNIGIGLGDLQNPDTTLHVKGQFKYDDGNQSAGAKLISDASGNASWELPSFGEMGFGDSISTIALALNTPAWVTNPDNDLWSLGAVNFSNGVSYTGDSLLIETAGVYQVNIQLSMSGSTGSKIELKLFKNGVEDCTCSSVLSLHNNEKFSLSYTDITDLSDGDVLRVFVENTGSADDVDVLNGKITLHRLK